ncbi:MAG: glycosyltransferase family 52 [Pseudomonadota bacterium]|nr:glycosyltransferase family 52 [Pseudomonadota bacterium]
MIFKKEKNRSLIMCVTPLQMIIAEKIIQLNPKEDFDLLVIALSDNDKYRYYYDRLKSICVRSLYYTTEKGIKGFFSYIGKLKKNKLNEKYESLYLASIDSRHFQYILSRNKKANIYTFDDGTANIIPQSLYYSNSKPKLFKKIIWRGFGIKHYMEDVKKLSLLHYTIYKDAPNIIEKTQFIKLYGDFKLSSNPVTKVVKIYLGQPLEEISVDFNSQYVAKIIAKLDMDFYYPHPREKVIPKGEFDIITSQLVFEDYIVSYLEENPEVMVEVYSFISSAMLNIASLDRIELNYIYDSYLYEKYKIFYEFAKNVFSIQTIRLN